MPCGRLHRIRGRIGRFNAWTAASKRYVERRNAWVTRGRSTADLDEFGWMIEELRVSVFAPELRTAVPVSTKALTELWATLPA